MADEERNVVYNVRANVDSSQLRRLEQELARIYGMLEGLSKGFALALGQPMAQTTQELMGQVNTVLQIAGAQRQVEEEHNRIAAAAERVARSLIPITTGYTQAANAARNFFSQTDQSSQALMRTLVQLEASSRRIGDIQQYYTQNQIQGPLIQPMITSRIMQPSTAPPGGDYYNYKWTGTEWYRATAPWLAATMPQAMALQAPQVVPPNYQQQYYDANRAINEQLLMGYNTNFFSGRYNAAGYVPNYPQLPAPAGAPPYVPTSDVIEGQYRALPGGAGGMPPGTGGTGTPIPNPEADPNSAFYGKGGIGSGARQSWADIFTTALNNAKAGASTGWAAGYGGGGGMMGGGGIFGGLTGAFNTGVSSFLGTPGIGELVLAISALTAVMTAMLAAYRDGNKYLEAVSATRKETGVPPQEAADLRALFGATPYGGMSQFLGQMVFQQVQANLQNVADYKAGLIQLNPIQERFNHSLEEMGVSAVDSTGKAKSLVPFTMELSKALHEVLLNDPGRYAQVVQGVGNMFGRLYSTLVGTDPALLQSALDSAVRVNQKMLDLTDARTIAVQNAVQAEKELEIVATRWIVPIDIALQKLKQIALIMASATLMPGEDRTGFLTGALGGNKNAVAWADALTNAMAGMHPVFQAIAGINQLMGITKPDVVSTTRYPGEYDQATLDKLAQEAKKYQTERETTINKEQRDRVRDYTQTLDAMTESVNRAAQAQAAQYQLNAQGLSSFDSLMDRVTSAAKAYDSWYQSYKDTTDKIHDLETKRDTVVQYTTINGRPLQGTTKKVMDLAFDIQAFQAESKDEADRVAKLQADITAKTGDMGKSKKPISLVSQNALQDLIDTVNRGGVTGKEKVVDLKQAYDMAQRAQAMGFLPGEAITTENLRTAYGRQGLSKADADALADAYERLKQLTLQDKEAQLQVVRTGTDQYMQSLNQQLKDGTITQDQFNQAAEETVTQLSLMAQSAGLFESTGFARAIGEAALQAKLASGGFGDGAAGVRGFADAAKDLYDKMDMLKDVLSGSKNITKEQAIAAGLLPEQMYTGYIEQQNFLEQQYGHGVVTGKIEAGAAEQRQQQMLLYRLEHGMVGAGEIMQLLFKGAGLEPGKGIQGVANVSLDVNIDAAKKKADEAKKYFDELFNTAYSLNINFKGLTIQEIKDLIAVLKQEAQNTQQVPPIPRLQTSYYDPRTMTFVPYPAGSSITPNVPTIPLGEGGGEASIFKGRTTPAELFTEVGVAGAVRAGYDLVSLVQDGADSHAGVKVNAGFDPFGEANKITPKLNQMVNDLAARLKPIMLSIGLKFTVPPLPTSFGGTGPAGGEGAPPGTTGAGSGGSGGYSDYAPPPPPQNQNTGGTGSGGGGGKFVPAAGGMPVYKGMKYIVGDEGGRGELFSPYTDGEILNATMTQRLVDAMQSYRGGPRASYVNSIMVNNTVQVDARGNQSPANAERAVRRAASAIFMTDDWRYVQRQERRRSGME